MRILHVLGVKNTKKKTHGFGRMPMRTVTSYPQTVRRCLARCRPCSKASRFTGRTACSKRSTALIVRLFAVFARSEPVYDMHCVPLRVVFLHQGSWEGHRLRPTGRNLSGTWMHLQHKHVYGLGLDGLIMGCSRTLRFLWFGHGCSGNAILSNMNVILVWAGMLW